MSISIDMLDTPAVLVDIDKAQANIDRAQQYANTHGFCLRPHIKTHKLSWFAHKQVQAGAVGITCQKLTEAEIMAQAGLSDILLTYNIIGAHKLGRLVNLARQVNLSVVADNLPVIEGYDRVTAGADIPALRVFVECDTGGNRCGVQTPHDALTLAQRIMAAPNLCFAGLMTYPASGKQAQADTWLEQARSVFDTAGVTIPAITVGGTPDLWTAGDMRNMTEYRPGTYIYMDRSQVAAGAATIGDCALSVLATVISRPTDTRAIIDAGTKTLTSDLLGQDGYGHIIGHEDSRITALSEEHGTIHSGGGTSLPAIGDKVRIIPNHACVVTNMFDHIYLVSDGKVIDRLPVIARGGVS
ncbi:D-TA family PLP-dependent enzyme [Novacetimonas hansenii]|uniref:D-TA family PLP-dependent enzyme n=1 Tax=Novacetimonas hansenii TaxID=436 RepID=UPI00094FFD2F|nr:D-TA family PLP-dependent enzyme [Novacetimonas hansenii]PYD72189.1 alanine racemase [Novacetimonas hansenii]